MAFIIDIVRFMTIGCMVLIIIQLIKARIPHAHKFPSALFAISCLSYLVVDGISTPLPWHSYPFLIFAMTLPYTFWIFSKSIFEDGFKLRWWMAWGWLIVAAVDLLLYSVTSGGFPTTNTLLTELAQIMQQGLSLIFVVLAIVVAAWRHRDDLILARLHFRSIFIWCTAVLIIFTLLSEISFRATQAPQWLDLLQKLVIAVLTYWFAIERLRFREGFYLKPVRPVSTPEPTSGESAVMSQLHRLMEEQEAWKTEGLTIRALADMLKIQEYKLRKIINQHLGYSNFNEYLNQYRIEYAKDRLADPKEQELTVLEVAYDAGYHSLSPFNKAFKRTTGLTPTQWRKSRLGKS